MSKVYNTQGDISTNLSKFFSNLTLLSKPILNNLSTIIVAMIVGESSVTHDIAKNIKDTKVTKLDSVIRRIRRFLSNHKFNINSFYDLFIRYVISTYKLKHDDSRVHILFDHVFILKKYVVLVFSLRCGRTSIPLWFKSFKIYHPNSKSNGRVDKKDPKYKSDNYQSFKHIKEGILYCQDLFNDKDFNLIYLGDRGFFSIDTFKFFDKHNITYNIRIKADTIIRVNQGHEKGHTILLSSLKAHKNSRFFYDVYLTKKQYRCNIVISRKLDDMDEAWFIATNASPTRAVKDYGYRFSIETTFKNMKTNGFYLEKSSIRNLYAFNTLFGIICIAITWMVIIGGDLSKNRKDKLINATKKVKGKVIRVLSLFNAGLTWFHKCLNSLNPIFKLKYTFILVDI